MGILRHLFATRAMRSRRQVGERAAQVIERVIFDMGVDRLVQGTFALDRRCRPYFSSAQAVRGRDDVVVALAKLDECAALRTAAGADPDPQALRAHTAAVVAGLLREFEARSARFRALPAASAD